MAKQRRTFSDEEKLNVLSQAGRFGISNTLRHYNISYSVFSRWRRNYMEKGINPIGAKTELKHLLEENARLKKIIAEMALSMELKDEELRRIQAFNERR